MSGNGVPTKAQALLLAIVERDGMLDDFYLDERPSKLPDHLWFPTADRVVAACERRGWLDNPGNGRLGVEWAITDAGRAALKRAS